VLSSLRQGFAVPVGADSISFRILSTALGKDPGLPPDAFEAALLDPVTGASLLGTMGGLDLSDAFLNIQANGTVSLAPGVTISGNPLAGEVVVTVSLAGVDTSNGAFLSFDLIGQGALDSRAVIDSVGFGGAVNTAPVAREDRVSVAEDGSLVFDPIANDTDVDGDPLGFTVLAGPLHGTLTAPAIAGGDWTYTPDPDFFGRDAIVYSLTDNLHPATGAIVWITVTPMNDAPVLGPVADRSTAQCDAVSFALSASDIDDAPAVPRSRRAAR
jgi:hypothetical protein